MGEVELPGHLSPATVSMEGNPSLRKQRSHVTDGIQAGSSVLRFSLVLLLYGLCLLGFGGVVCFVGFVFETESP
jgi:hypothetical protein